MSRYVEPGDGCCCSTGWRYSKERRAKVGREENQSGIAPCAASSCGRIRESQKRSVIDTNALQLAAREESDRVTIG
ncbi:MAG TPA: hypothetical protein VII92_16455, partial [Anaerolineae bacterium]